LWGRTMPQSAPTDEILPSRSREIPLEKVNAEGTGL
jgi:hypothetical protein